MVIMAAESKHEPSCVTISQYQEFLSAVAAEGDLHGLYDERMGGNAQIPALIMRSEFFGRYSYAIIPDKENFPINYVSNENRKRFCNWCHNNKPSGKQETETTETGAYTLNEITDVEVSANQDARYYLLNEGKVIDDTNKITEFWIVSSTDERNFEYEESDLSNRSFTLATPPPSNSYPRPPWDPPPHPWDPPAPPWDPHPIKPL